MFKSLKKKSGFEVKKDNVIMAPIEGELISIKEVSDPTFSNELLGKGIAIKPKKGRVVSPVNGEVTVMVKTKHAIGIASELGTEILIHIGLDTVNLKGEFFTSYVDQHEKVKAGDLLLKFDIDKIKEAGYDITSMVVVCNTAEYSEIEIYSGKNVAELDEVMKLIK